MDRSSHLLYNPLDNLEICKKWLNITESLEKSLINTPTHNNIIKSINKFVNSNNISEDILNSNFNNNPKLSGIATKIIRLDKKKIEKSDCETSKKNKKAMKYSNLSDIIDDIRVNNLSYKHFIFLNELWKEYINNIISINSENITKLSQICNYITQCDFHGALLEIIRSNNKGYINLKGIIIKETQETFVIISKDNKVRTLIKSGCTFMIHLDNYKILLFGTQFCYHPAERIKHKFRHKASINAI
ncbi:ribonuclease P protein subunit, putative [Cryptosporidium muris RN66]|uniref:Ribonuclease P protein subunit p29 n=1 Tax=Cryptosporidium muris (strain RN66) TaxID=441375 RepID=B6AAD3_CRYMR|nr:ribonuclease P protein subunit, putative [Cryptosporidium muris RN66]EEA05174.1 ribonuclease P protein subunit, putative [Cryptosporidium muris RN66]|eukprot:XP_002139523.1 ribonuclease P protein subunit [Cryptosporidium muris RN66]